MRIGKVLPLITLDDFSICCLSTTDRALLTKGAIMNQRYEDHLTRTLKAVHMEKVDKIPFSWNGPAYLPHRQGLKMSEAVVDYDRSVTAAVDFCNAHPEIDSLHSPCFCPYVLPTLWLAEVKVPGKDLPDDELWQMHEKQCMTEEDYQIIIDEGYGPWMARYMEERIGDPMNRPETKKYMAYAPTAVQRMRDEAGIPIMNSTIGATPIENFCGARGMVDFFVDTVEEPELLKKAMDAAWEVLLKNYLDGLNPNCFGAWCGGWRAAPQLMSHDTWMVFVWPYLEEMILKTIEAGVTPVLHFDSCWDNELETLKTLPARKCVLMLDGFTDVRKAREVLDDRMCLLGDVPASMLAFGTASEVYDYCMKLFKDVGPTGLMLSSGCDCPLNAKDENVDAMLQSTLDYRVG